MMPPTDFFSPAAVLSTLALVSLCIWLFFDDMFGMAVELIPIFLGLHESPEKTIRSELALRKFGLRLIALAILVAIGVVGLAVALLAVSSGAGEDWRLKGAISGAVVSSWIVFIASYGVLKKKAMVFRVKRELHILHSISIQMSREWPKESGTFSSLGRYSSDADNPNMLLINCDGGGYSFRQKIGPLIRKVDSCCILFDLIGYPNSRICFTSDPSRRPQSFMDEFKGFRIEYKATNWLDLGHPWYLITYKASCIIEE